MAVSFLISLFIARPSFYILDEVEAALDDTNLGRLLEIYEELRVTSQLLVITHQSGRWRSPTPCTGSACAAVSQPLSPRDYGRTSQSPNCDEIESKNAHFDSDIVILAWQTMGPRAVPPAPHASQPRPVSSPFRLTSPSR